MTATTLTTTTTRPEARPVSNRQLRRTGAVAAVAASVATTGVAVAADAMGVPITIGGESITTAGFAQLTLFFSAVGIVMASIMARRSAHARNTFVKTTLALTALSFVPDVLADAQTATKLTLMLAHIAAAAIVIPALASRLAD
ncbi:MAG: hypothetical protein QOD92_1204 [Acidimicrobiaceae bacterium]|jgi:hypothetical protein